MVTCYLMISKGLVLGFCIMVLTEAEVCASVPVMNHHGVCHSFGEAYSIENSLATSGQIKFTVLFFYCQQYVSNWQELLHLNGERTCKYAAENHYCDI